MKLNEETTHKLITGVLAMQISQNILIDLQGLKFFKNALKMQINRTIDLLTDVERKYYDDFLTQKKVKQAKL